MEKLLFTPDEARELLRVGRTTMYNLLHEGEIESMKINRKYFITKKSLENYIGMKLN